MITRNSESGLEGEFSQEAWVELIKKRQAEMAAADLLAEGVIVRRFGKQTLESTVVQSFLVEDTGDRHVSLRKARRSRVYLDVASALERMEED